MKFYEQEVRAQNEMLQSQDANLKALEEELTEVRSSRRSSIASTASAPDNEGVDSEETGRWAQKDGPVVRNRRHTLPPRCAKREDDEVEERTQMPCLEEEDVNFQTCEESMGSSTGSDQSPKEEKQNNSSAKNLGVQPLTVKEAEDARCRSELIYFFQYLRMGTEDEAEKWSTQLAHKYAGDGLPELWAKLGKRFNLSGFEATMWLARSLGPFGCHQWPNADADMSAPPAVKSLLERLITESDATAALSARENALRSALSFQEPQVDELRALSFFGCPDEALRPCLWTGLLGVGTSQIDTAFRELKATKQLLSEEGPTTHLLREVRTDAAASWRGEEFAKAPAVQQSVVCVALAAALAWKRNAHHVPGICDMVTLLIFVLARGSTDAETVGNVEAEAYACLRQLLDRGAKPTSDAGQANRVGSMLRAYDPELAQAMANNGLAAMPATRLSAALCTKAGFALRDCAMLWDALLADPVPFDFCEHVTVAMLLLSRRELLKKRRDVAGMAEVLLAAPTALKTYLVLKMARAICAFERQCGPDSPVPFPPRVASGQHRPGGWGGRRRQERQIEGSDTLEEFMHEPGWSAAVSSLWGKVRKGGVDVWKNSRQAIRNRLQETAPQQNAPCPRASSVQPSHR